MKIVSAADAILNLQSVLIVAFFVTHILWRSAKFLAQNTTKRVLHTSK